MSFPEEVAFWSTYAFKEEEPLAGTGFKLFSVPMGKRGQGFERPLGLAETNQRTVSLSYDRCAVHGFGVAAFGKGGTPLREMAYELLSNLVLTVEFLQTSLEAMPPVSQWQGQQEARYYMLRNPIQVEGNIVFGVQGRWGEETPVCPFPFRVRVNLGCRPHRPEWLSYVR